MTYKDGATIAQASQPSMKLPISLALHWPDRLPDAQPALDFTQASTWEFEPLDNESFPAVELARKAAKMGDPYPAVYNAANEGAVDAFFARRIKFPNIVDVIAEVLEQASEFAKVPQDVYDVMRTEAITRERVGMVIARMETQG